VENAFSRLGTEPKPVVFRPAGPMLDDEEARLPPAALSTSAKLMVTDPKLPLGPGLDLASLAENAIVEKPQGGGQGPTHASAPTRESSWRDDRFGPYQLVDRVAIGGMAEVFKAKRAGVEGFEKVVAVKRILPHLSYNNEFVEMFVAEAKLVAGLHHPNIVAIFDLGKIGSSYYIAMEYVNGADLRSILKKLRERNLRMPIDLAIGVVSAVAAGLNHAHQSKDSEGRPLKIVHRDVSPQNILISWDGEVKLTDFGIAKAATKASNTDRGALRGKLLYMSPEQAWGKALDRRSDIFSLGLVFYEMVTDQKPFLMGNDGSEMTILEKVRRCEIASARGQNPKMPESVDRLVMKALARDPDERYQDAAEMARAVERVIRERQPLSANELKRFMELLFDRDEREEAIPDDLFPDASGASARDGGPSAAKGVPDSRAEPAASETRPDAELSVDALLRRFGIK
jgi:serine/threonine-protein kinase